MTNNPSLIALYPILRDTNPPMTWKQFTQPENVFSLAALQNGGCLAGTDRGLWAWNPKKKQWQPFATQFEQVPISAVAAVGETLLIGSNGDIAYSKDNGATWTLASLVVKSHVFGLAMSPNFAQDGLAFAATARDGVLRSPDGGETWYAWNFGLIDLSVNSLVFSPNFAEDDTLFAGTELGVFISQNQGRAWRELGFPNDCGPVVALAMADNETLLAATEGHGLMQARSPYADWSPVAAIKADGINAILAQNHANVAATTSGIYSATQNNGKSQKSQKWARVSNIEDAVALTRLSDNTLVVGTAGSGIWQG